jgi:hypothetical protein
MNDAQSTDPKDSRIDILVRYYREDVWPMTADGARGVSMAELSAETASLIERLNKAPHCSTCSCGAADVSDDESVPTHGTTP